MKVKRILAACLAALLTLPQIPVQTIYASGSVRYATDLAPVLSDPLEEGIFTLELQDENGRAAVMAAAGQKTEEGTPLVLTSPKNGDTAQAFIVRRTLDFEKDGTYYLINVRAKKSVIPSSRSALKDVRLKLHNTKEADEYDKWRIDKNGASYTLRPFKDTGLYLSSAGSSFAEGEQALILAEKPQAANRFSWTVRPVENPTSFTETDRTSSERIGKNMLQISGDNKVAWPQNTPANIGTYVSTEGNFITRQLVKDHPDAGRESTTHWLASDLTEQAVKNGSGDWTASALPFYDFVMDRQDTGEKISIDYPVCGTYGGVPCGATVTFSNMRYSSDVVFPNDADVAPYQRHLRVATFMSGGYWYYGIQSMQVKVAFYYAENREPIIPHDAYLTFNSLNGCRNMNSVMDNRSSLEKYMHSITYSHYRGFLASEDRYGEFVGYYGDTTAAHTGYTWGSHVTQQDHVGYETPGTNVISLMLNIKSPYREDDDSVGTQLVFIGQRKEVTNSAELNEAGWNDGLGQPAYSRNSVSLFLDKNTSTSFIVGCLGTASVWNAFSAASVYTLVDPPVKTISSSQMLEADGTFSDASVSSDAAETTVNPGGTVTFKVTQKISRLNVDTTAVYDSFRLQDTLPEGLAYLDSVFRDAKGNDITSDSQTGTRTVSGNTVSYDFTPAFLARAENYDGGTVTYEIRASVGKEVPSGSVLANKAVSFVNGTDAGHAYESNETKILVRNTKVTVTKNWDDESDAMQERPKSQYLTLLRNGKKYLRTEVTGKGDSWTWTWDNLPAVDAAGNDFTYAVQEAENDVPGKYTVVQDGGTITNRYEYVTHTVKKIWSDESNRSGLRPQAVKITLLQNGKAYGDPVELKGTDSTWTYLFKELPRFDGKGKEYVYTAEETAVPEGYTASVKEEGKTSVITNALDPFVAKTADKESFFEGEEVTWSAAATIPHDIGEEQASLVLTDTLDSRLTFLDLAAVSMNSGQVSADGKITEGEEVLAFADGTDYRAASPSDTGGTLKIEFTKEGLKKAAAYKDKILLVRFRTVINSSAKAGEKIPNDMVLHAGSMAQEKTFRNPVTPSVRTDGLTVIKTDDTTGKLLAGAVFKLYTKEEGVLTPVRTSGAGHYAATGIRGYEEMKEEVSLTTATDGRAELTGLADGTYYLKETKAPEGYLLPDGETEIVLSAENPCPEVTCRNTSSSSSVTPPAAQVKSYQTGTTAYQGGSTTGITSQSPDTVKGYSTSPVRTGDDAPILLYLLLLAGAGTLLAVTFRRQHGKRSR